MRNFKKIVLGIGLIGLVFYALTDIPSTAFLGNGSRLFLDENSQILRAKTGRDGHFHFISADSLPDRLKQSILQFEDAYFYYHLGVNPISMLRALLQNLVNERVVSGASTISMQLAKRIHNHPRRLIYKLHEILLALRLEMTYSKEAILQMYCNHVPYGRNLIGYTAASLRYFGKFPKDLSWAESALLAVLPNAPGLLHPEKNSDLLTEKRNRLLLKLKNTNLINDDMYQRAILEMLPENLFPFPFKAAHFCDFVDKNNEQNIVRTTCDGVLQEELEHVCARYYPELLKQSIEQFSMLVIKNSNRTVAAYIGSADYWNRQFDGMVDGIQAMRSSGSTLKPILYAYAIQDGLISTESLIHDVPSYYNGFSPYNANEKFKGLVTAETALLQSLNVPFVRLLYQYDTEKFYYRLKSSGFSSLYRTAEAYGLPIILGGSEIRSWDLGQWYSSLANRGKVVEISAIQGQEQRTINNDLNPYSATLTLHSLKNVRRPEEESYWQEFASSFPLAWKTGTSYGQKDAWAVGVSPDWTIVVWAGNFSGKGNPNLWGSKAAGKLLFHVFNRLPKRTKWFQEDTDSATLVTLCSKSGFLATDICKETQPYYMPKSAQLIPCKWHRKIYLDSKRQYETCSLCWTQDKQIDTLFIVPATVSRYMQQSLLDYDKAPLHRPDCPSLKQTDLQINYPREDSRLSLVRELDGEQLRIIAEANASNKDQIFYWYLDQKMLDASPQLKLSFQCPVGRHRLTVIDSRGVSHSVHFEIVQN